MSMHVHLCVLLWQPFDLILVVSLVSFDLLEPFARSGIMNK